MKLRLLAAVAVLVSAYVHLRLYFHGFKNQGVVGPAFLVNAVAGVVIALLLLTWEHWVPAFLTLGFGASTLGAFVVATLPSGLFGVHERWIGTYTWTAAVAEVIAVLTGAVLLLRRRPRRSAETTGSAAQAKHRLTLRGAHHH